MMMKEKTLNVDNLKRRLTPPPFFFSPPLSRIGLKDQPLPLLMGTFPHAILPDQCIWSNNIGRQTLDLMIEKADGKQTE